MNSPAGFAISAALVIGVALLVLVSAWEHWAGKKVSDMRKIALVHLVLLTAVVLTASAQSPSPSPAPLHSATVSPLGVSIEKTPMASAALAVWLTPEYAGAQVCKPPKESSVEGPDGKTVVGKVSQCVAATRAVDWKPGRDVPCFFTTKLGPTRSMIVIHQED